MKIILTYYMQMTLKKHKLIKITLNTFKSLMNLMYEYEMDG